MPSFPPLPHPYCQSVSTYLLIMLLDCSIAIKKQLFERLLNFWLGAYINWSDLNDENRPRRRGGGGALLCTVYPSPLWRYVQSETLTFHFNFNISAYVIHLKIQWNFFNKFFLRPANKAWEGFYVLRLFLHLHFVHVWSTYAYWIFSFIDGFFTNWLRTLKGIAGTSIIAIFIGHRKIN